MKQRVMNLSLQYYTLLFRNYITLNLQFEIIDVGRVDYAIRLFVNSQDHNGGKQYQVAQVGYDFLHDV